MKFDDQRLLMVKSQLVARGIKNPAILEAFSKVPRHEFVPASQADFAYQDFPVMLGEAGTIAGSQTASQPYIVALMMEIATLDKKHKVLEIGTGSGYQTALLANLVAEVYSVERLEELYWSAKDNLRRVLSKNEFDHVYLRHGDGTRGWEKAWPPCREFDRIIVTAAAPKIPEALKNQLAEGGMLIIPAGNRNTQTLNIITKKHGRFVQTTNCACTFVPLIGEEGWPA